MRTGWRGGGNCRRRAGGRVLRSGCAAGVVSWLTAFVRRGWEAVVVVTAALPEDCCPLSFERRLQLWILLASSSQA